MFANVFGASGVVDDGVAPAVTTLVEDAFTDTNGTALGSHAIAPTNVPGASWTNLLGVWTISGNKAVQATASAIEYVCQTDIGVSNIALSADITTASTAGRNAGLNGRITDANNYWRVRYDNGGTFALFERNGGTYTNRASTSYSPPSNTVVPVTLTLNGTNITATIAGGNAINYSSATHNQNATKHGMNEYRDGSYGAQSFDNFQAVTVP